MRDETTKPGALFVGVFPCGISYCDRSIETSGDYLRVAFLPYDTLELRVYAPQSSLLPQVIKDAATIQARRGEQYDTSDCGQTVLLGGK